MIFLGLVTTAVVIIHQYLWRRLVRDTRLAPVLSGSATLLLLALAASVPLTVLSWGLFSRAATPIMTALSFGWLGLSFYLVLNLAAWDIVRACHWLVRSLRKLAQPPTAAGSAAQPEPDPQPLRPIAAEHQAETRRVFMARTAASGALLAAGSTGLWGVRSALWDITMPEVPIALPRFPRALDGYTVALISDVHIGPLLDGRFLRQLAERINAARPDAVAIVGDLVDGRVAQIGHHVAELRRLQPRQGVHFVTGNHEYYSHAGEWLEFLRGLGVNVLMNQRSWLGDAAHGGARFELAGVPDRNAGYAGHIAPDAALAARGRDDQTELVMLAHQPVQIGASAAVGAGLQLSGHTHGGQLYPFGAITLLAQPYLAGLHRHPDTETQIYVSRGTGFWGPPMRVLAPAEVALLRLHAG